MQVTLEQANKIESFESRLKSLETNLRGSGDYSGLQAYKHKYWSYLEEIDVDSIIAERVAWIMVWADHKNIEVTQDYLNQQLTEYEMEVRI